MPQFPLVTFGASEHGKVVADAARCQGRYELTGMLDDNPAPLPKHLAAPFLGGREQWPKLLAAGVRHIVIAVGDNDSRCRIAAQAEAAGFTLAVVIHPRAVVAADAQIGPGSVLMAGSVVNPGARLGRNVIVNTSASVDHDCDLGDGVHVGPGAHLAGAVRVGSCTLVAVGAIVRDHVVIGASTIIGAGAVVVENIPDHVVAYGVPAKVIRRLSAPRD